MWKLSLLLSSPFIFDGHPSCFCHSFYKQVFTLSKICMCLFLLVSLSCMYKWGLLSLRVSFFAFLGVYFSFSCGCFSLHSNSAGGFPHFLPYLWFLKMALEQRKPWQVCGAAINSYSRTSFYYKRRCGGRILSCVKPWLCWRKDITAMGWVNWLPVEWCDGWLWLVWVTTEYPFP